MWIRLYIPILLPDLNRTPLPSLLDQGMKKRGIPIPLLNPLCSRFFGEPSHAPIRELEPILFLNYRALENPRPKISGPIPPHGRFQFKGLKLCSVHCQIHSNSKLSVFSEVYKVFQQIGNSVNHEYFPAIHRPLSL